MKRNTVRQVGKRTLKRFLLFSCMFLAAFVLVQKIRNMLGSSPANPYLSLVIPATREDFLCYSGHLSRRLRQLAMLPNECIIVVSDWQGHVDQTTFADLKTLLDIHLITLPHVQNQARNRNTGAAIARGEYIFFFDIDDVLHKFAFASIFASIRLFNRPDGVVFSHGPYSNLRKPQALPDKPFCMTTTERCAKHPPHTSQELFRDLFEHWFVEKDLASSHWCCMRDFHQKLAPGWLLVKRSSFLTHGIFDDSIQTGEDGNQIARMIAEQMRVMYFDVQIGFYNQAHQLPACEKRIWPGGEVSLTTR